MSVYLCVYVCDCVCEFVCVCECACDCAHAFECTIHVARVCVCVCVRARVCIHTGRARIKDLEGQCKCTESFDISDIEMTREIVLRRV